MSQTTDTETQTQTQTQTRHPAEVLPPSFTARVNTKANAIVSGILAELDAEQWGYLAGEYVLAAVVRKIESAIEQLPRNRIRRQILDKLQADMERAFFHH